MKKILKILIYTILIFGICLYVGIIFIIPQLVNNQVTINKLQSSIHNKTGIETNINGLNLKISYKLVLVLNIDSLDAKKDDVSIVDIKNITLKYKLLKKHLTLLNADSIYIDESYLRQLKDVNKKKKNNKPEFKQIPEIHIKKITYKSDNASVFAKDIDTQKDILHLNADITTPFLNETIKLGYLGSLQFSENNIRTNQFEIKFGNSSLYVDGYFTDKDDYDFNLKGEKLPVSEIIPTLLKLQKFKDPSKKFIENFKNFKGIVNINLKFNKDGIWGTCIANNLGANAIWFDIPLFFKEAVFNFKGQTVNSNAEGILGKEKVTHSLNITDLLNPQKKEVIGTMKTTLTKNFDYVPNLTVLNSVNFNLVYKIKDRKPDVYYNIDIPVNSDLIYKAFYLGLRNYNRKISANTFKDNNTLYLKEYKYSYSDFNKENIIISGDGLFMKNMDKLNPDKFIPQFLACHTNGFAPISVIGSFGEKVKGGEFKGDLKYDFRNNQVLGTFDIMHAKHQAFNIDKAHIVAKNGIFNITSNGLFKDEKYSAELNAKNNITGETLVYNMKLFLDKLIIETTPNTQKNNKKINPHNITEKVHNADITINNWEIVINEIKRDKFVLQNVKLFGSMKNNLFDFTMKELNFADGTINANGIYDFAKNTSKMEFEAKDINSNKAAETTLNLKNQIEGTANAKVSLDAKDMFRFLDVHCLFEVKEGFLPKLGDTELMIQNTKYKLSEIVNFDLTQKDLMKDDIKGYFDVHNTEIKNINITTWHELSAMFLEGNYEMEKQYADLSLFWHYSKDAPKGIRIFCVPLSLILKVAFRPENTREIYESKLSKIPKINADEKNSSYYRIQLCGDINNNKTDLKLKEIR